nr:hypothetical protein [uncultured Desulfobacter sp.]
MIEATETQVKSDLFDFLRIIDDEILSFNLTGEIGSETNFSLQGTHQLDSGIQSEAEIKEQA